MNQQLNRKSFLQLAAGTILAGGCCSLPTGNEPKVLFGACRSLGIAKLMKEVGYDFIEHGVGACLVPDKGEEAWKKQRDEILSLPIPLRSCNGFIPGTMRLTGKDVSFDEPLKYAETACRRADEVGLKTIVLGSSTARNAPEGFPVEKAVEQFVEFGRRLTARIAGCKVTVVLEPLRAKEANYLNFVSEGVEICKKVDSPRLQMLADIFHMIEGGESAESIINAGVMLKHCHVAEKGTRTAPGLNGDGSEFLPYFKALKKIGYSGGISVEGGWGKGGNLVERLRLGLDTMRKAWQRA